MLPRIEISDVMRTAMSKIDEHNKTRPLVKHKRLTKDGEVEVVRRAGIIPEAVTQTFHVLLTDYIGNYNRMKTLLPMELQNAQNPPALRTNSVKVSKFARCTDRTVRNHISSLRELGLVETKFHGTKQDFELWIKPDFLFSGMAAKTLEIASFSSPRKNFPDNRTYIEIIEKEKGNADMLIKHIENNQGQQGQTEQAGQTFIDLLNIEDREIGAPAAGMLSREELKAYNDEKRLARANALLNSRKPQAPRNLKPEQIEMLMNFWLYAWKTIYPRREFTKEQQEKALLAITNGVYAGFDGDWDAKKWQEYHLVQMAKLDKAGKYYDNNPEAYRPDPYAVHVLGKGYFDEVNLKGFIGIDAWIKKDAIQNGRNKQAYADKQDAKVRRAEALLRTARRDFEKLRRNERPRKEIAMMTDRISLFSYYNAVFQGLGKKWQDAFCRQYLGQESNDFQAPKYDMAKKMRAATGEKSKATVVIVEDWMNDGEGYYSM